MFRLVKITKNISRSNSISRICSSKVIPSVHPDGLTRYPGISSPNAILRTIDWAGIFILLLSSSFIFLLLLLIIIGTAAFAVSGTVTAGYAGMDLLGCEIVGTITAIGGGTVRDLLIGNAPVFWVYEYEYILLCLATCSATLFAWKADKDGLFAEDGKLMFWTDAIGLGAFCSIGAQNGIRKGFHPVICILCGMITATFGGVIRDVLTKRPPRILHSNSEIYATTALSGATVYLAIRSLGASPLFRIAGGIITAVAMRYAAVEYNIRLPLASWYNKPPTNSG